MRNFCQTDYSQPLLVLASIESYIKQAFNLQEIRAQGPRWARSRRHGSASHASGRCVQPKAGKEAPAHGRACGTAWSLEGGFVRQEAQPGVGACAQSGLAEIEPDGGAGASPARGPRVQPQEGKEAPAPARAVRRSLEPDLLRACPCPDPGLGVSVEAPAAALDAFLPHEASLEKLHTLGRMCAVSPRGTRPSWLVLYKALTVLRAC